MPFVVDYCALFVQDLHARRGAEHAPMDVKMEAHFLYGMPPTFEAYQSFA